MKLLSLFTVLLFLNSCTKKVEIPHAVTELDHKIEKMEKDIKEMDNKLKLAMDHGLEIETTHERELLKSRLEREKERIRKMWPTWDKEKEAKAAAGAGGGGGH